MPPRELMLAESCEEVTELWHRAVREGERCADVFLGSRLETHLVITLKSYVKDIELCSIVAKEFLSTYLFQDSEALIKVAGRCLLIAGFFPALAQKRNVRIGYFVNVGTGAYDAHANYWFARGRRDYASLSKSAAERFPDLMKTLRGMKNSPVVAEEIEALNIPHLRWN